LALFAFTALAFSILAGVIEVLWERRAWRPTPSIGATPVP